MQSRHITTNTPSDISFAGLFFVPGDSVEGTAVMRRRRQRHRGTWPCLHTEAPCYSASLLECLLNTPTNQLVIRKRAFTHISYSCCIACQANTQRGGKEKVLTVKQQHVHLSRYLEYAVRGANLWQRVWSRRNAREICVGLDRSKADDGSYGRPWFALSVV